MGRTGEPLVWNFASIYVTEIDLFFLMLALTELGINVIPAS